MKRDHIIFLYDEDIKKILAKYYKVKPEEVIFNGTSSFCDESKVCYKIVFPVEEY